MSTEIISPLASVSHISLMHRPYGPRIHLSETAESAAPVDLPADAPETFDSVNDAAAYFTSLQEKRKNPPAESAETATAEPELSGEDNAGPETVPGENAEEDPEVTLPPIERPRSWSKDDDDEWAALPRARQEKIAANEQAREADIGQRINKAAEAAKAAEAKAAQADQVTKALAAKLPEVDAAIQEFLSNKYPDIKSMDDVVRMAHEADRLSEIDPFASLQLGNRLKAWEADQQRIAGVRRDAAQAAERLNVEQRQAWAKFVQDESSAFAEAVPEYTAKKADYDTKAAAVLREIGFTDDELNKLASGEEKIPLFDRRIQRLLFDRIKLSEIKAAPKAVVKPDLPPVLRPGASRPPGSASSEREQALTRKTELSVAEATELYTLQHSRRRAS